MVEPDFQHVTHKVLRRLVAYWFEKRSHRIMPSRSDIDPVEIPWALAWIWLCDYQPSDRRFRYRLAGEQINAFWGYNIGGRYLDEIVPEAKLSEVNETLATASEGPTIVHDFGRIYLEGEVFATGERIILPLSDDGRKVSGLLGASCRDWHREIERDGVLRTSQMATLTPLSDSATPQQTKRSTLHFSP
jgi:hypothetical protein